MDELRGKIAIVTGAGNGIGLATARLFAAEGAKVIGIDFDGAALLKGCSSFAAVSRVMDVSQEKQWEDLGAWIGEECGRLDVLANVAGIVSGEHIEDASSEIWDCVMGVNAKGCYLGMKMAVPFMKEAGGGAIVNISSIAGLIGSGGGTAYHASKSAIRALTKRVATHYGFEQIRANTIYPGWIETNMTQNARPAKVAEYAARQALPYFGRPEDIAQAALFLVSDRSRFITGADLVVDGGFTVN